MLRNFGSDTGNIFAVWIWKFPLTIRKDHNYMKTTGNTILITGGGSGIGRALAESFHALGNQVIISGRRATALDEVTHANPGMASHLLDIENPESIRQFATQVASNFPAVNVLI